MGDIIGAVATLAFIPVILIMFLVFIFGPKGLAIMWTIREVRLMAVTLPEADRQAWLDKKLEEINCALPEEEGTPP